MRVNAYASMLIVFVFFLSPEFRFETCFMNTWPTALPIRFFHHRENGVRYSVQISSEEIEANEEWDLVPDGDGLGFRVDSSDEGEDENDSEISYGRSMAMNVCARRVAPWDITYMAADSTTND